jgi:5'-3' exonuclease
VLAALAVPVVTAEGFEADDVIATLTDQAEREGSTWRSSPVTATPSSW